MTLLILPLLSNFTYMSVVYILFHFVQNMHMYMHLRITYVSFDIIGFMEAAIFSHVPSIRFLSYLLSTLREYKVTWSCFIKTVVSNSCTFWNKSRIELSSLCLVTILNNNRSYCPWYMSHSYWKEEKEGGGRTWQKHLGSLNCQPSAGHQNPTHWNFRKLNHEATERIEKISQ